MNKSVYRLGTRKSLLAIAQSSWVARSLERLNPGITVELVGIETRGDVVLDKPLSQIEGKEFFTAELDHALMRGDVDLTVHSMKDLSLDRPPQIKLGATPLREFQHDIIVFHDTVIDRIKAGLPVRVGTSSPRRLTLVPGFLKIALPRFQALQEPKLEFVEIRGNVNTRLSRIHEPETSDRKLDAVVLAFAGLERLAIDAKASIELHRLLENTRRMVLPLRQCPSAPAQGALAIEVRADAPETFERIQKLHDPITLKGVVEERKILEEWGGGCHQKLGASFLPDQTLAIKGVKPTGEWVTETRGRPQLLNQDFVKVDASDLFDFAPSSNHAEIHSKLENTKNIFVAHSRAYDFLDSKTSLKPDAKKHIWVSGMKSWIALANHGVWVEGSVEGAGFKKMAEFQSKKLLALNESFTVLTHVEAAKGLANDANNTLGTYTHQFREIPEKLRAAKSLFWSSGLLFETAWSKLGADFMMQKKHASGPGKTADAIAALLTAQGGKADVFTFES